MNAKLTSIQVNDKKGFLATIYEAREPLVCHRCQAVIPAGTHILRKRIRKPWTPARYGACCPTCEPWTEIPERTIEEIHADILKMKAEENA